MLIHTYYNTNSQVKTETGYMLSTFFPQNTVPFHFYCVARVVVSSTIFASSLLLHHPSTLLFFFSHPYTNQTCVSKGRSYLRKNQCKSGKLLPLLNRYSKKQKSPTNETCLGNNITTFVSLYLVLVRYTVIPQDMVHKKQLLHWYTQFHFSFFIFF